MPKYGIIYSVKGSVKMEKYIPDIYQKSIYTVDYSKLLSKGIKCLLFDLDNTIVPPKSNEMPEKAKELFISLKQKGFKVIIFSNSPKSRVKRFKEFLNVNGVHMAAKPFSRKLKKLLAKEKLNISEVAIIGDQLLTDVAGGNKIGITTILINPITSEDHIFSVLSRWLEKQKLKKLKANFQFDKGTYYD